VDINHFTNQAWNRGHKFGPKRPIEDYLSNTYSITSHALRKRLIKEGYFEHRCSMCSKTEWLGNPIPLELDHIDGDRSNNNLDNLRLLCPNCHALTPNYRGRKKRKRKLRSGSSSASPVKSSPNLSADSQEVSHPVDPKAKVPRKTKIPWPKRDELEKLIWATPRSVLALQLGVSDTAIAKRCKHLNISQPPRGYWAKLRSGTVA
jgi:hypothetical protein